MSRNKYGGYADCKTDKRVYNLWYFMLRRCYDIDQQKRSRGKSYAECTVCERWMNLSNFAKDIQRLDGNQRTRRRDEERNACDKNPACDRKLAAQAPCFRHGECQEKKRG